MNFDDKDLLYVSDDSIQEVALPPKQPPVVIDLDEESHLVLNISGQSAGINQVAAVRKEVISNSPTLTFSTATSVFAKAENPYHWDTQMQLFYNEEDNDLYDMEAVRKRMDCSRKLWEPGFRGRRRYPCFNCGFYGHDERACRPVCCRMCGDRNHYVDTCPKSVCLSCGVEGKKGFPEKCVKCKYAMRKIRCDRCLLMGHGRISCSDHWRRFHHVTTLTAVKPPVEPVYKRMEDLWCCNCARKGHDQMHCREPKPFSSSQNSTFVASYVREFSNDAADLGLTSNHREGKRKSTVNENYSSKRKRYFEAAVENELCPERVNASADVPKFPEKVIPTNNPGIYIVTNTTAEAPQNTSLTEVIPQEIVNPAANKRRKRNKTRRSKNNKNVIELLPYAIQTDPNEQIDDFNPTVEIPTQIQTAAEKSFPRGSKKASDSSSKQHQRQKRRAKQKEKKKTKPRPAIEVRPDSEISQQERSRRRPRITPNRLDRIAGRNPVAHRVKNRSSFIPLPRNVGSPHNQKPVGRYFRGRFGAMKGPGKTNWRNFCE